MDSRLFSEKEAVRIIERAAKLQEASREGSEQYSPGISLEELERIAAEAGIDPAFLVQALQAPHQPEKRYRFGKLVEEHELILEGELTEDGWDDVGEVVQEYGRSFAQSPTRRTRTFTFTQGWLAQCQVDITSSKGRTRLHVKQSAFLPYMAGLHTPLILGVAAGIPLSLSLPMIGIPVMLACFVLGFTLFNIIRKKVTSETERLVEALSQTLARAVAKPQVTPPLERAPQIPNQDLEQSTVSDGLTP